MVVVSGIFSNMILEEYSHEWATRARAGELCFRLEEFPHFMERVKFDIVLLKNSEDREVLEKVGWLKWVTNF